MTSRLFAMVARLVEPVEWVLDIAAKGPHYRHTGVTGALVTHPDASRRRTEKGTSATRFSVLLELVLLVYCLVHVITSPEDEVRNLPKWAWILLILFFPLVGGIAYLIAGRPVSQARTGWAPGAGFPESERPHPSTSDIDESLAADLARLDREHEESLRRWEADLRKREHDIQGDGSSPPAS